MSETSVPREPISVPDDAESIVPQTTPVRSPWLMTVIGVLMTIVTVALAVWATEQHLAGNPTADIWTVTIAWVLLPLPSIIILGIGLLRVRWWFQFKKATGKAPVTKRYRDVYGNRRGNISVGRIAREFGLRRSVIRQAATELGEALGRVERGPGEFGWITEQARYSPEQVRMIIEWISKNNKQIELSQAALDLLNSPGDIDISTKV